MSDDRAHLVPWIAAAAIVLTAAGAYTFWLLRTRALMPARSLTAATHPSNAASGTPTKSLHVEGCNDDFIVQPGELVEPRVVPGASVDQFRAVYGKETDNQNPGSLTWDKDPYSLMAEIHGPDSPENSIHLALNQGHVVETLDGVELGIDSFGTIFRKMRDKKVEVHERIERGNNGWVLVVSMYSACGRRFRSEYLRTLPFSPETDRLIAPRPAPAGGQPGSQQAGQPGLLRSDVFMNKIMFDYVMVPSDGHDDSAQGSPSDHD